MKNVVSCISEVGGNRFLGILQVVVAFSAFAFGQEEGTLPTWPGDREVQAQLDRQRVFLSEDRASVRVVLGSGEETKIVEVPLLNRIVPTVKCSMVRVAAGTYSYTYDVENGHGAKDPIGRWSLVVPMDAESLTQHRNVNTSEHWGSGSAWAPVGRQMIPGTPNGRYVVWLANYQENRERPAIRPGQSAGGFELSSNFLPGFTTAYVAHWRYVSLDREWPDEVHAQIAEFWNNPLRRERHLLTFGPQFASTTPVSAIVDHFSRGLETLAEGAALDGNSPFIEEVRAFLSKADVELLPHEERIIRYRPRTEFEMELATALQLSLRVRVGVRGAAAIN
jgi:hypothetical protein